MNLDDLRFLTALRRHHTMSATAKALGTNIATVSRRLERFTNDTGQTCFARSVDGWHPLPHMNRILDLCETFEQELKLELDNTSTSSRSLVIGAPPFFNLTVLIPALNFFPRDRTDVQLELHDRTHGEGLGDCDIVLRADRPTSGRLIARKVGKLTFSMYRHANWNGTDWLALIEDHDETPAMKMAYAATNGPPAARFANFEHLAVSMARLGMAGPLPDRIAASHESLVPMFPDLPPSSGDIWCCYHAGRKLDPVIRKTIDWIETAISAPETKRR